MTQINLNDALGFVTSQASYIEREVLRAPLPMIRYAQDIPIDTSPDKWASSVTFFTQDAVGRAKYINGHGDDIPLANVLRRKFESGIDLAGIGYMFSLEEIGKAQRYGVDLPSDGAMAARTAYEQFVQSVAYNGDATAGTKGLYNSPDVTSIAATASWSTATSDQILADLNAAMSAIYTSTTGMHLADTVRLPIATIAALSVKRLDATSGTSLLDYISRSNLYTITTGRPLDILGTADLTNKAVIYQKDPAVLKMFMPMPLEFVAPQPRNLEIYVPGMFRFSPVNIRRPSAIRYITGV